MGAGEPDPPPADPLEGWLLGFDDSSDDEDEEDFDEEEARDSDYEEGDYEDLDGGVGDGPLPNEGDLVREAEFADSGAPPSTEDPATETAGAGAAAASGGGGDDSVTSWGNGLPYKAIESCHP